MFRYMFEQIVNRWVLISVMLLAACAPTTADESGGSILLWYSLESSDAAVIEILLDRFEETRPGVNVVGVQVDAEQLLTRYITAAQMGLGPDIFIGPSQWISELGAARLIRDISDLGPNVDVFFTAALENVRYEGGLYGLPLSLEPVALYYNTNMVTTPAATLDGLLADAADGRGVALNTDFDYAFWGVQALGGQIFDSEGRVLLNQGGVASWLNWLRSAQDAPGMFLSRDRETLVNLFTAERVAYYTGRPDDLRTLRTALGETAIAATTLPSGQGGTAGPLLFVNALMFNPASSNQQAQLALRLAQFLTNAEQSNTLLREVGFVPSNRRLRINARIYPVVSGFASQVRTSVPVPNTEAMALVLQEGETTFVSVLDGVADAVEAVELATERINTALNLEPVETIVSTCDLEGQLVVWHALSRADNEALESIAEAYQAECPNVSVRIVSWAGSPDLPQTFRTAVAADVGPDLLITSSDWTYDLASTGAVRLITGEVLQRHIPAALETLTYQGSVFALPLSFDLNALYYNSEMVSDPARTLDDLLTDAASGLTVLLPAGFEAAYWGIPAYGGQIFDGVYRVVADGTGGVAAWLAWLDAAQVLPGVQVSFDRQTLDAAFANGEAAYYVGPPSLIAEFERALGAEVVRVTTLPQGPVAAGASLVRTDAVFASAALDPQQADLALHFATFATRADSQRLLTEQTGRLSANVNVVVEDQSSAAGFRNQVSRSVALPRVPQVEALLANGDALYRRVLTGGVDPAVAVAQFAADVNASNGMAEVTAEVTAPPEVTAEVTPELTPEITPDVSAPAPE
ncbi:MAG: extracellular solute-binding protein [Chloroflexi bacterium]|nr:extracellular solute-binding protein [Chloroflexota bacterium]